MAAANTADDSIGYDTHYHDYKNISGTNGNRSKNLTLSLNSSDIKTMDTTCYDIMDIVYIVLLVTIVSAGIVGNALSLIVLHLKSARSNFNFLIKVLSFVDIIILLLLPIDRIVYKFESSHIIIMLFFEYFVDKIGGIMRLASVWMLIVIAFFRYMAVCVPMKVKLYCTYKNARRCVIAILILDLAIHIPFYFEKKLVRIENTTSHYYLDYTDWGNSSEFHVYAHVVYTGCMFFVLPFLSLIFFSIQMIRTLCGNQREKYFALPHLKHEASDVTKVVIAIIVVFLISYTPYLIWTIDSLIPGRREKLASGACFIFLYRYTLDLFLYVNSSVNFFIYLTLRKQFRYSITELFRCHKKGRKKHKTTEMTIETELSS